MEWVKSGEFDSLEEYLKCFVWLTTTKASDIVVGEGKRLGCSNALMEVEYDVPNKPAKTLMDGYWINYAWIIKSYLREEGVYGIGLNYHHFKMAGDKEEPFPPIPQYLVKAYRKWRWSIVK